MVILEEVALEFRIKYTISLQMKTSTTVLLQEEYWWVGNYLRVFVMVMFW